MAFPEKSSAGKIEASLGKAARGAVFLTISQGVFIVCSFLFYIFLAKEFGPENYGVFGFVFTILAWLEIFVYGTRDASIKCINEYPDSFTVIYRFFIRVQLIISLGLTALLYLGFLPLIFTRGEYGLLFFVAFLDLPLMGFSMLYQGLLNGNHLFRRQAVAYGCYSLAKAFFIILFVKLGYGVAGALFGNIFSSITGIAIGHLLLKPKLSDTGKALEVPYPFNSGFRFAVHIVKASIIFILIPLFYNFMMSADLWLVNLLIGGDTSGFYMGAITIAKIIFFLFSGFYMALFSTTISSINNNEKKEYERIFSLALSLFFYIALPLTALISINSGPITMMLYGEMYSDTGYYVSILAFGYLFLTVLVFLAYLLYAKGLYKKAAFLLTGSAAFYVLAVFLLIETAGATGAAIGMALACCLGLLASYALVKREIGVRWPMQKVGISILLSACVFTPLAFIPKNNASIIPLSLLFLLIYFALLFATKTLTLDTVAEYARAFMKVEKQSALAHRLMRIRVSHDD